MGGTVFPFFLRVMFAEQNRVCDDKEGERKRKHDAKNVLVAVFESVF